MDFKEATRLVLEVQSGLKQAKAAAEELGKALPDEESELVDMLNEVAGAYYDEQLDNADAALTMLSDPNEGCEAGDGGDEDPHSCPHCGRDD